MKHPGAPAPRHVRFAYFFSLMANARQAAIKAGYSPRSAHVTGCRLLKQERVQTLLLARDIDRVVHAKSTYARMIKLSDVAMRWALQLLKKHPGLNAVEDIARALTVAGNQLERVAKAEGLLIAGVESPSINVNLTIQQLVQQIAGRAKGNERLEVVDSAPVQSLHQIVRDAQPVDVLELKKSVEETKAGGNGAHA